MIGRIDSRASPLVLLLPTYFPFLPTRCVSAEPAALLAALLDLGFRSTFAAFEAAFLPVTSPRPFAIITFPILLVGGRYLAPPI
jgi:hypothetical protein